MADAASFRLPADTSQTYLLFQTLLLLFCPHSCMIWTKLTRTNAVFSRAACMVYLCAGKWIFRRPRKFPENSQKMHAPEGARSQKWDQRRALGAPGAPLARPGVGPRHLASWVAPPSSGALPILLFIPVTRKPQNRSRFPSFRRGAAATLCSSSRGLIWRLIWPPKRGDHRHRHHHHHSIPPP